jgi:hypothetical protein
MKEINSEIEIFSTPEQVWRILTDFDKYPQWNPFINQISGELKKGSKLTVHVKPEGSRGATFNPTVTKVEPNREMRWIGHFIIKGLMDGEHMFTINSIGNDRIKFINKEIFTGLLSPMVSLRLKNAIHSFEAMNRSLKERAEKEKHSMK